MKASKDNLVKLAGYVALVLLLAIAPKFLPESPDGPRSVAAPEGLPGGTIFLAGLLFGFALAGLLGFVLQQIRRATDHEYLLRLQATDQRVSQLEQQAAAAAPAAADPGKKFLNIPSVSLHVANKDQIESLYNDYSRRRTSEQITREVGGEVTGEASGTIPQVFGAKVGKKAQNKTVSTYKIPDLSLAEKFRLYQEKTIREGQVALGLESADVDLSELDAFNKSVAALESQWGMRTDPAQLEQQRALLKKKAAEATLLRLEAASGWLLMEGKFTISDGPDGSYQCTFEHPVNEYLNAGIGRVTIGMMLRKDAIDPNYAGNYAQSVGRSIPLKVYAQVWEPIDRVKGIWEMRITPLAVYS